MRTIQALIKPNDQGTEVTNLQDALRWLYAHVVFKVYAAPNRPTAEDLKALFDKLAGEQARQLFGEATRQVVLYFQIQQGLGDNLKGAVEATTAERINQLLLNTGVVFDGGCRVFGTVTDPQGAPQKEVLVSAWDRDLRRRQPLGKAATTDTAGRYVIDYQPGDFGAGDLPARTTPWLIVEARRSSDGEVLQSVTLPPGQVATVQQVDLQVPAAPAATAPEFTRLTQALAPLLKGQGAAPDTDLLPHELGADDWPFLSAETGFGSAELQAYADSARMLRDALALFSTPDDAASIKLLNSAGGVWFYSATRQGLANRLADALPRSDADWMRAWTRALASNQVPPLTPKVLDRLQECLAQMRRLDQIRIDPRATTPLSRVLTSLKGTDVPRAVALLAQTVIEEHELIDPDAVLKTLSEKLPNEAKANATLVRGLRLHQLTAGDSALMGVLHERLGSRDSDSLSPLAALPASDWVEMAGKAGASAESAVDMQRRVELQHASHALQMRLESGHLRFDAQMRREVQDLLGNQPTRVEDLLTGKTAVKDNSLGKGEAVLKHVGTSMRLGFNLELAGHFAAHGYVQPSDFLHADVEVLKEIGDKMGAAFNTHDLIDHYREAATRFVNAGRDIAVGVSIHGRSPGHYLDITPIQPALSDTELGNVPDMPSLFGDMDECGCRPCESMLGQPAYLVDLLELLRQPGANAQSPVLNALIGPQGRRKDIATLPLDCAHSETELTHIERVLEVLQTAVRPDPSQTTDARLAGAVFPWLLPFDQTRAQASSYLSALGVERDRLLRWQGASAEERAAATLGRPYPASTGGTGMALEWSLLCTDLDGNDLWRVYGLPATVPADFRDPASEKALGAPTSAAEVLGRVSVLLDRTGLALDDFRALLGTRIVGGADIDTHNQCKTSAMTLVIPKEILDGARGDARKAQAALLNRIHRCVRLRAAFPSWTFDALDRAMTACGWVEGFPAPTAAQRMAWLTALSSVARIADRHHLSVEQLCRQPFAHAVPDLAAALGLRPFQFELLCRLAGFSTSDAQPDWAKLESCLLLGEHIQETRVGVETLSLLLLPPADVQPWIQPFPAEIVVDPTDSPQVDAFLASLRQALRKASEETPTPAARDRAMVLLQDILAEPDALTVVEAIDAAAAEDAKTDAATRQPLPQRQIDRVAALLGSPDASRRPLSPWPRLMSATAITHLLAVTTRRTDAPRGVEARYTELLDAIREEALAARRERSLLDACSGLIQTTAEETAEYLRWDIGNPQAAHLRLLDTGFWGPQGTDTEALQRWCASLLRLQTFKNRLNNPALFDLIRPRIAWYPMLNPSDAAGRTAAQAQRIELVDALWLGQADHLSAPVMRAVFEVLDAPDTQGAHRYEQAIGILASRLEWTQDAVAIAQLAGASNRDALKSFARLTRIHELLLLARQLQTGAGQLAQLRGSQGPSTAKATAETLLAARLGVTPADPLWRSSEVRESCENRIRQSRRDALVAFLLQERADRWRTPNDLYEHLLIDPMVAPCMKTTQVLEAISAVQLFCQRLLFGLEAPLRAPDKLRQQWTWMRNYRVWEANRKVFLFPENWLYPELRDDKSSSFLFLETELGRGEINSELARAAFGRYLDDVVNTAGMQTLGMWVDEQPGDRTLYVVGRTPNAPYAYHWRRCASFGTRLAEWGPWKHIDLDIQSEHMLPFVLHGFLHIAWPVLARKDGDDRWSLRYFWSRFDGKQWARIETSSVAHQLAPLAFTTESESFTFRCAVGPRGDEVAFYSFASAVLDAPTEEGEPAQRAWSAADPTVIDPAQKQAFLSENLLWGSAQIVIPAYDGNPTKIEARPPERTDFIGAIHTIEWEVWIKAQAGNGSAGYVQVVRDPNGWEQPAFTLHAAIDEVPFATRGIGQHLGIWIADATGIGAIPAPTCWAQYKGWRSAPVVLRSIPQHMVASTGVKLVITPAEAHLPTLSELGIADPSSFVAVAEFELQASGESRWRAVSTQETPIVGRGQRIFRNGLSGGDQGSWPLLVPLAGGASVYTPFQAGQGNSGRRDFWLLGTADLDSAAHGGMVWWYRQGPASTFIDIKSSPLSIELHPSTFEEAPTIRREWRASASLDSAPPTPIDFSADKLPDPTRAWDNDAWVALKRGERAFDLALPYGAYNWEIFFHAPLLIADQLSKQHQFEEAERWLRFVFDPTSTDAGTDARRFFRFRPFKELDVRRQVVDDLKVIAQMAGGYAVPSADRDAAAVIDKIIDRWRAMPFRPFVIARGRIVAFLWRTLFAYLDNLIAWADSLYRQDTRESNTEAMMLYVMARRILGRQPQVRKGGPARPGKSYADIADHLDDFANYWVDAASRRIRPFARKPAKGETDRRPPIFVDSPTSAGMLLFCMPFNEKLTGYWNTVEIRLFNLRHCRNIDGVERDQPFTSAPIDPELLVRAVAAGLDLGSVVAGLYAPPPHYRHATLSARATELANEARALGGAMLSAIEKRDAERMAQLRSTHELQMLKLGSEVRKLQIQEAQANIGALRATRASTAARYEQYQRLLGLNGVAPPEGQTAGLVSMLGHADQGASKRSGLGLIREENQQYLGIDLANTWLTASTISKVMASGLHASSSIVAAASPLPNPPKVLEALANVASQLGDGFSFVSQGWRTYAEQQGMLAGHLRRRDDWAFQSNQTLKELQQIDKQILANQIRIDITRKELDNHLEQMEQNKAVDEVLRSKFSNADLYEWMGRELFGLYDKTYRMALTLARQAERAAQRELGPGALQTPVIQNNHWNSQRDGLLAAERLHHDLKRLELAYLERNKREFELTRHISLRRLSPEALLALRHVRIDASDPTRRRIAACEFELPEWVFDMDTPGHFMRRIKSVSISMPCVTGPYAGVHAKLTLLRSTVRVSTDTQTATATDYRRDQTSDDPRFLDDLGASDSIVTSTGSADSGLFETPLRDERFLPFEGRGVVSRWRLELPADFPQFDYQSISDVVLTLRYTARDGGGSLRDAATHAVQQALRPSSGSGTRDIATTVLLSCRSEFPEAWHRRAQGFDIPMPRATLPYWMQAAGMTPRGLRFAKLTRDSAGRPVLGDVLGSASPPTWTPTSETLGHITETSVREAGDLTGADDLFLLLDLVG